jgi:hypothetical protein
MITVPFIGIVASLSIAKLLWSDKDKYISVLFIGMALLWTLSLIVNIAQKYDL